MPSGIVSPWSEYGRVVVRTMYWVGLRKRSDSSITTGIRTRAATAFVPTAAGAEHHAIGKLASDVGVAADHVGQRRALEFAQDLAFEDACVPEAVAVAETLELVGQRPLEQRTDHGVADPVFAQAFMERLAERLRGSDYEVWITPFGWFCEWGLDVHGESLAKVWKEI